MSYLIPGVDLLSIPCITKSDVQQAIAQAKPVEGIGFVIVSDTAPDVVTYPELAYFIWLGSNSLVPNGTSYYYNGSSWSPLVSQDGSTIDDNSIPLSKINRAGSAPYNIIQVNAAGNGLQWISVVNAIQNGSIPLAKLVGGAAGNFFFASLSGTNSFLTLASIVDYLNDNTIPIMRLVRGPASAHGLFLRTFEDGSVIEWVDFDANEQIDNEELNIQKLKGSSLPVAAGQAFRRNAGGNAWEAYTPVTIPPVKLYAQIMDRRAATIVPEAITLGAMTTKELNTTVNTDALIVSLAANQFVLAAGTYDITVSQEIAQVYASLYLVNITTPGILLQGINCRSRNNTAGLALLSGRFTVAAGQTLELQYYASNDGGGTSVLGYPRTPATADDEIYTVIDIKQA